MLDVLRAAEGFYWAPWTALLRRRLQRKLRRKHVELTALAQKRSDAKKLSEKEALRELHLYQFLADFHVSTKSGRPSYVIERPTRIGNVIAAYELYAQDRYGFDGVFWWFHVRFSAPAAVQMELDRSESIADGMVLCTVAGAAASLCYATVLACRLVGILLQASGHWQLLKPAPAPDGVLSVYLAASLIGWTGFNRLSIFALRNFGREMRAVIDLAVPGIVKLAEPWLPNDAQKSALDIRKAYLKDGNPITDPSRTPSSLSRDDVTGRSPLS